MENHDTFTKNEELMAMVLNELALAGQTPSFMFGDFQLSPQQSGILANAQDADLLFDLHTTWCQDTGQPLEATCFPTRKKSKGRRIDLALANHAGKSAAKGTFVMPHSGLPTHRPLRTFLDLGYFESTFTSDTKAKPFNSIALRHQQLRNEDHKEGFPPNGGPKRYEDILPLEPPEPPPPLETEEDKLVRKALAKHIKTQDEERGTLLMETYQEK